MKSASGSPSATIAGTPSLTTLFDLVNDEMALVEDWLKSNLIDDNAFVEELLKQIFHAGGKRIRPLIVLLSSKATARETGKLSRLHIILAVLTELIHTASLVHDDVIDKASVRRGVETINKRWNDRIAVLMGDLLFAQASICLARIMNPVVVGIYGQVLGDLCSGEIKQMRQQFLTTVDWDAYIDKSVSKTASLFAAGSHSGAILNGCPNETIQALKEYGLNLGICFQIVDDLLDITGSQKETGKAVGSDLRNGVVTAPAMFILERNDANSAKLKQLIDSRAITSDEGAEEALTIIRDNGGVDATIALARRYADKAIESLAQIKDSSYKDGLASLAEYVMTRTT
jgi:all-trans-nonaprenyl-diphosphate synthase